MAGLFLLLIHGYHALLTIITEEGVKCYSRIYEALNKALANTDFDRLVVKIRYALSDIFTGQGVPGKKILAEIIAKLLSKLLSGPLKECNNYREYREKGEEFLVSREGTDWGKHLSPGSEPMSVSNEPVFTKLLSSCAFPQDQVSLAVSSPTDSASPKELPSPNVSHVNDSPLIPHQIGEAVPYAPEGFGICLHCRKRISYSCDHTEEINGLSQRLSSRRVVGTFAIGGAFIVGVLIWLLGVFVGSQFRQQ